MDWNVSRSTIFGSHWSSQSRTFHKFRSNYGLFRIDTKVDPIETAFTMSIIKRYDESLQRACRMIRQEEFSLDKESTLQAAIKFNNDSAGPDDLVTLLLVIVLSPVCAFLQAYRPFPLLTNLRLLRRSRSQYQNILLVDKYEMHCNHENILIFSAFKIFHSLYTY